MHKMNPDQVFVPGQRLKTPEPSTGDVPVWAFTTITDFEMCPYKVYKAKVEKVKVDNSDNAALNRGIKVHDDAEKFVRGEIDLPAELKKFEKKFLDLRELFSAGMVELEENWGVKQDWSPCSWRDKDLWGRIKLDAFVMETPTSGWCIDYKTGRKFGNELKHGLQGMFYTIAAFERYPELQTVQTDFWYVDKGEELNKLYTRAEAEVLKTRVEKRALALTTCTSWPPRPSQHNCKWCDYKKENLCEWSE